MESNKEILNLFSEEQSLISSSQNQTGVNTTDRLLELFVTMMPKIVEAFRTPQTKEVVSLRIFIDEYVYLIKNNSSASYAESVQLSLNHFIAFFGIQRAISSIQLKDIESFLIYLQQKVKKGYVVYFRNLKAAFNKARDCGYVTENFFTKIKLPKKQKTVPMFINSDQLSVICSRIINEIVKDFVLFAYFTGMRLGEIINLRWKNVDLSRRIVTVGDEEFVTKGRNQRFIPMSDEVQKLLLKRQNENRCKTEDQIITIGKTKQFVFCKNNGERFTGDHYSKEFKKACIASGLDPRIHFHTLRHSFASNLAQKGVSLYTIKELLGHSSISTTEIYSHLNMDSLREAVEKLEERGSGPSIRNEKEENKSIHFIPLESSSGRTLSKGIIDEIKIFRIGTGE